MLNVRNGIDAIDALQFGGFKLYVERIHVERLGAIEFLSKIIHLCPEVQLITINACPDTEKCMKIAAQFPHVMVLLLGQRNARFSAYSQPSWKRHVSLHGEELEVELQGRFGLVLPFWTLRDRLVFNSTGKSLGVFRKLLTAKRKINSMKVCGFLHSRIFNEITTQLRDLKHLRIETIHRSNFANLEFVKPCKQLKSLEIVGCFIMTAMDVIELAHVCPNLIALTLIIHRFPENNCKEIFATILDHFTKLKYLCVHSMTQTLGRITMEETLDVIKGRPKCNLQSLVLVPRDTLDNESLKEIFTVAPSLHIFNDVISGNRYPVENLAKSCKYVAAAGATENQYFRTISRTFVLDTQQCDLSKICRRFVNHQMIK